MDSYFSPQFYMTLFRIYLVVRNFLEGFYSITVKTARRALLLTYPQEYVFFSGYTTPYLASTVGVAGPGVPSVAWVYNLETNILSNGVDEPPKSLPWLAASIRYNGLSLYSLDEFISEVKYSSRDYAPSPAVVVGSWSLRTGTVLDNQVSLELVVITEHGEEKTVSPWSLEPITSSLMLGFDEPVTEEPVTEEPVTEEPVTAKPMTVEMIGNERSITFPNETLDE